MATQSLSDIARGGGDTLVGQILNNCNNYIIQRQNNPKDAEVLANVIGTKATYALTAQIDLNQGDSDKGSVRHTREFLVHPDEIKRLTKGTGYVVNKQNFTIDKVQFRKGVV